MGGGAGIMISRSTEESVDEYTVWTDVYHRAGVGRQVRCRLLIHTGVSSYSYVQ